MRVLSDIPMAYWQAVYPDKLLQFKPLDGLRLDLLTVIGIIAVIIQVRPPLAACLLDLARRTWGASAATAQCQGQH